jgi:hypothetical protein
VKVVASVLMMSLVAMMMLNAIPASSGYDESMTYKLIGDGYITGTAEVTCWQYGDEPAKVDIRIDVLKVFHSKGKNELSAYIVDVTKNGPESYMKIGNNVIPKDKYDYARFSQQFDEEDFPATGDGKSCPIDSVGRIVVVVGTSPPSDNDTLNEGAVDIIAEAVLSTSSAKSEDTTDDSSTDVGKEEPDIVTEEPEVEPEVEAEIKPEVEEPEIKVAPYSITSEPKLVDPFGGRVEEIVTGQPVLVQTKVSNNLNKQQPFLYILQVKDSEGFTVMLTWIKGTMNASADLDAGISWAPENSGKYTVEVFVWKSLEDPGLPLAMRMIVSVED